MQPQEQLYLGARSKRMDRKDAAYDFKKSSIQSLSDVTLRFLYMARNTLPRAAI